MTLQNEYNYDIEQIRDHEFPALKGIDADNGPVFDHERVTYVDHVGTTLYSHSQMSAYQNDLVTNLYGNPHSHSASSRLTTDTIDQVRYSVLKFFGASPDEYSVIFTSGCTGALKLIAETFTFCESGSQRGDNQNGGCFVYLLDNHTSVQGMRELVCDRTSGVYCLDESELEQEIVESQNQICKSCDNGVNSIYTNIRTDISPNRKSNLFTYPGQSNFSGRKYSLEWIDKIQSKKFAFQKELSGKWYVVLDAACMAGTSKLDLHKYKPDFVTVSFYKIFGFPTGLGALIVKRSAVPLLSKQYFGGGTVAVSDPSERYHVFRSAVEDRFEDGTLPFLNIIALRHGLEALQKIAGNMDQVSAHTFTIAKYFHDHLALLRHGNKMPVASIYCDDGFCTSSSQGAIVTFNIRQPSGDFVGFAEVDKLAQLLDIHLRTGCFCNMGACQKYLRLTSQQVRDNFHAGHVCGDDQDMIDGRPTGSVRISFGYMSTYADAQRCLNFIVDCFLEGVENRPDFTPVRVPHYVVPGRSPNGVSEMPLNMLHGVVPAASSVSSTPLTTHTVIPAQLSSVIEQRDGLSVDGERGSQMMEKQNAVLRKCCEDSRFLTKICLYPVKSCAAFEVSDWEMGPRGLLHDRQWMVVGESGVVLGQKREPRLCLLHPQLDPGAEFLTLNFPDMPPFQLQNTEDEGTPDQESSMCTNKVCGDRVTTLDCGNAVSDWLSEALGRPGTRLLRQKTGSSRTGKLKDSGSPGTTETSQLSLANESQFLLISRESVRTLRKKIIDHEQEQFEEGHGHPDVDNLVSRFRGNFIIGGGTDFEEDEWSQVRIGNSFFTSQGRCTRCQMICVDQETAIRSKEPLRTLVSWRGKKVPFGIYMRLLSSTESGSMGRLHVGDEVIPQRIEL